jgi:hypothetical protein
MSDNQNSSAKKSPEIVTEQDLAPSLPKLDVETFLKLYSEWKVTHDPSTFASLRSMHENAGYNNKSIMPWTSETEMHQIAAIVQRYKEGKVTVTQSVIAATAGAKPAPINTPGGRYPSATGGDVNTSQWEKQIDPNIEKLRDSFGELTAESLQERVLFSEQVLAQLPETREKSTLRNIYASLVFEAFRVNGHNLVLSGTQVTIVPKAWVDVVDLQEKLQTLVNTGRLPLESLKVGMLYSSPTFARYVALKKTPTPDGKILIDPKATPEDFMQYVTERQKAGDKSPDLKTLVDSKSMVTRTNFQAAIAWYQDMGQMLQWVEKNPKEVKNAAEQASKAAGKSDPQANPSSTPANTPPTNPGTGNVPNNIPASNQWNYLSSQLIWNGGQASGLGKTGWEIIGGSFKGFWALVGDLIKAGDGSPVATLGIGAAILYGIWKMFHLGPSGAFNFGRWLGAIFGIGFLNSMPDHANTLKWTSTPKPAPVPTPVTSAPSAQPAATTTNTPTETISQKSISDKIRNSPELKSILDPTKLAGKKKNGTIEDYLKFINTDLKDTNTDIFLGKTDASVFSRKSMIDPSINLPTNLDPAVFKNIMRMYITGAYMSEMKMDDPANVAIIKTQIAKIPNGSSSLSEAITAIHK